MAESKRKGDLGEAMIMADILRRGYKVALPIGEDWRYDLIVLRQGKLERVQCKYVSSDGAMLQVPCRTSNSRFETRYTIDDIDWLACYHKESSTCYYIPAQLLGQGRTVFCLRIRASKNNQTLRCHNAADFLEF